MSSKQVTVGGAIAVAIAGLGLLLRETVSWLVGKILDHLPLPKSPGGAVNWEIIPWLNILAFTLLALGVFLFWRGGKMQVAPKISPAQAGQDLGIGANNIAMRLNLHLGIYASAQRVRDPMQTIINDGISLMLTFNKQGIACPALSELSADEVAWTMLEFFARIGPLLRDGHLDEAKQVALQIADQARVNAKTNGAFHND